MATTFPTSIDNFTNITDPLQPTKVAVWGRTHSGFHNDYNDAIEALEAKVGVDNSLVTTSLENRVKVQIPKAIQDNAYKYALTTGSVNAYIATITPAPTGLTAWLEVKVKIHIGNTGPSTLNVNGLGAISLKKLGGTADLANGDMATDMMAVFLYDGTFWELQTPVLTPPAVSILSQPWAYATDTGTANALVVTLSPAPVAYALGQRVSTRALVTNTGASTINLNGLGVKTIKQPNGLSLEAGMIRAGQMLDLEYDGTDFQLVTWLENRSRLIATLPAGFTTTSTTEWTALTTTVLGGIMGTNKVVRISGAYSVVFGLVATCTIRVKFGGTTIITLTADSSNLGAVDPVSVGRFEAIITNTSASAQQGRGTIDGTWGGNVSWVDIHRSKRATGTSAINTASNVTLDVTAQSSNASISMTLTGIVVELIS